MKGTISFNVTFDEGKEINNLVSNTMKQLTIHDLRKTCNKGKALHYLIRLGHARLIEILEEKDIEAKQRLRKVKGSRVEETIE